MVYSFQEKALTSSSSGAAKTIRKVKISALGTYVPPKLLTNADLEKMVETTNDWIVERTGIRERHIVEKGVATSDIAVEAAKKALAMRGIEASDLDAIFVATVTPDMLFPSTACLVQHKLGAKKPARRFCLLCRTAHSL
jgi:3-oxoacyl-[acyl-carrier-protein] synthase-3